MISITSTGGTEENAFVKNTYPISFGTWLKTKDTN